MSKTVWRQFPHPNQAYAYAGAALKQAWMRLHRGDCEPYPDTALLERRCAEHPQLEPGCALKEAARRMQDAWRAYHRGDFGEATKLALSLGAAGYTVANKAACIYATYLEEDEPRKLATFQAVAERAEAMAEIVPADANAHYFQAYALGRYGQGISVVKALAQGLGGKIRASIERTLELQSRHADAHIVFGTYHAEVIDKVGALVGSLTYGASKAEGVGHFEQAVKLNPDSAIARIEYANGLLRMFGEVKRGQAVKLYERACKCVAADAMEKLDLELAKSALLQGL